MSTKPVIIFDFDGTLADSFSLAVELASKLLRRQPLPRKDISRLRGLYTLPLLRELRIPLWRVPFLALRARRMFGEQLDRVELFPGMSETIRALSKRAKLYVLSSNSAPNVRAVLQKNGIEQYFEDIQGSARPLHKERGLRQLLRRHELAGGVVWYVGDEARDVTAAHHVGLRAMAVSWGYNNVGILERTRPDALVFSPDEILAYFATGKTNEK